MNNRDVTERIRRYLLPTALLLVGAWLRLGAFHEALVGADQSSILAAAADIVALRHFPLVGMKSSMGVMQTAVVGYLAAIPLLLVHRVVAISWFFGVLDLLALALLYRAVGRTFGRRAALVAMALYATTPWVVEFNRWIWYQTLIPTFATLAFSSLLSAVGARRRGAGARQATGARQAAGARQATGAIALAMISATLMGLVHLAALPWAALLWVVAALWAWRQRWWREGLVGAAASLLAAYPYAAYLVRTGFVDVTTILRGSGGEGASGLNWATYRLTLELLTGDQILHTPRNPLWANSVVWIEELLLVVPVILTLAVVTTLIRLLLTQDAERRGLILTLAWTVLAPTLFLSSSIHLQHFYLLFVFPAPYVLIATCLATCLEARTASPVTSASGLGIVGQALGVAGIASVTVLAVWWGYLWSVRIGYEQQGLLRAPTRAWLMDATAETVGAYLAGDPEAEVLIVTHFGTGELSPFDWIRNFVHSDRVRVVPASAGLIIPPGEACFVLTPGASPADLAPLGPRATERPDMAIPASPPWPSFCTDSPRPPLATPLAAWENGLRLLDSDVEGDPVPGGHLALVHQWHYRNVTGKEYHLFNHLVHEGQMIAQIDGAGVPTRYWRDDDVLITRFTLELPDELPTGELRLLTGAYTWPDVERVPLTDGADAYPVQTWQYTP